MLGFVLHVSPSSQSPKPKLNFLQMSAPEESLRCFRVGRFLLFFFFFVVEDEESSSSDGTKAGFQTLPR